MARVTKKKEEKKEVEVKTLTRAEKKNATQALIKDVLRVNPHKHNDLIDEVSKLYAQKFGGEDTENINDVKGRVGSVLDLMKKEGEVLYEGGRYALKDENSSKMPTLEVEEKVKKPTRTKAKKAEKKEEIAAIQEEKTEEQPPIEEKKVEKKATKKQTKKSAKALEIKEEKAVDVLEKDGESATITPVEQTAEVVSEAIAEKSEAVAENAPKKEKKKPTRAKAKKVAEKQNEAPTVALKEENLPVKEENTAQVEIKNPPVVKEKAELAQKNVVDMSFLFGNVKPKTEKAVPTEKEEKVDKVEITIEPKKEEKVLSEKVEEKEVLAEEKTPEKQIEKQEIKQEKAPEKQESKHPMRRPATRENVKNIRKLPEKPMTADERLREAYLKRLRALGGDYFEYYSVYLLERYSMKNGRRLEGLRISGGDHDGGIDGEIELTDRFGFKETIYIQSKNWDPEKGKEEYWVVGETLLQQFIGACACRQAKDGKQHCRGIFVTTSRFTPEAKRILEAMSDKIVGYDGTDLYEAAKECKFGLVYENGNWKLDEKLLSGVKAFFSMM